MSEILAMIHENAADLHEAGLMDKKTMKKFDELDIPHEELRYDDFDNRKMAFFFDPDGLPLEIHE